jgi:hypothetical protein
VPEALEGSGEEDRCFDKLSNRRREKIENGKREERKLEERCFDKLSNRRVVERVREKNRRI